MATPINQTRSVKYDPVPFATTATADSLQQHESIIDATVATLACTPLPVWRSWQFIGLALGDAVLIVIDVYAIAYAPRHVSGSAIILLGTERPHSIILCVMM